VEGDSQLVLNQMAGAWKIKNLALQALHGEANRAASAFGEVVYEWHPRSRSVRLLGH
jgi:ribonuclease H / adenosylcobalamin/alpha-ribazole phosphatase